jgi:nucleoside-diphosphate-sugar epimerase
VRALDSLLHGQSDIAARLEQAGVELIRGDVRDSAARERALSGAQAVVHLAAIVGDPACARDPAVSQEVNVEGTRALVADAARLGVQRFVFASTCSNYGRMADPTTPIDETGVLAPVSLYAEQKVQMEQALLESDHPGLDPVCLRFATIYGVAPRMRFDLTVNEFTRDLWADRRLEVFGEQFWRPYVHVHDAGRAVRTVLAAPSERVARDVFNVGRSGENYRKLDLVEEIRKQTDRGEVEYVRRDEDPRDYKVSFDKIRATLGFETEMTVPDGIAEVLDALEQNRFGDPFDGRYRNIP